MKLEGIFELLLRDSDGKELVKVESKPDTAFDFFDRVVVHGGHEYYVGKLMVERL